MIVLSNSEIVRCTENVARAYGSGQGAPLPFEKFSANVNQETLEALQAAHKDKPLYPMTIKIPKAQRYLKDGDFTPAQIIMIEEPIKGWRTSLVCEFWEGCYPAVRVCGWGQAIPFYDDVWGCHYSWAVGGCDRAGKVRGAEQFNLQHCEGIRPLGG